MLPVTRYTGQIPAHLHFAYLAMSGEFVQRLIDAEQIPEALLVNVQPVGPIDDHFPTINGEVNEKIDPCEPDKAGRKKPEACLSG